MVSKAFAVVGLKLVVKGLKLKHPLVQNQQANSALTEVLVGFQKTTTFLAASHIRTAAVAKMQNFVTAVVAESETRNSESM